MADTRTYVVGIDGSDESAAALEWVRATAGPDDRIRAVHAWDVPVMVGYDVAVAIDPRSIEEAARAFLDDVVARTGDPRVHAELVRSHPGRALVETGADASAVVVGHRGSGRMSMLLGSTASHALHHLSTPVVIIRGDEPTAARTVVVGADDHDLVADDGHSVSGENESVRALRWAWSLPGVTEVRVVHSWFLPAVVAGWYAGPGADYEVMDAASERIIDHVITAAGTPPGGVTVNREVLRGTPGFGLIEASRDVDLVVVGSRGRGTLRGLLLGSTSAEVASYAHCPVAVIR